MLGVPAARADVHAHVLDDAEHRHRNLLEHLQPLAGVGERDVLGSRHDDGSRDRHSLRERQLNVAGAGRHVDDQVIQRPPLGLLEQLRESLGHHGPAPHHRLLGIDQETYRHGGHAVSRERAQVLAVGRGRTLPGKAEHEGLARPVDVGVEHSDPRALGAPREREIHGDRGLADSSFAGGDRDDIADLAERLETALHGVGANVGLQVDGERGGYPRRGEVPDQRGGELRLVPADRKTERDARAEALAGLAHLAHRLRGAQGVLQIRVYVRVQGGAHGVRRGFGTHFVHR